jgi:hypothetical protein
MEFTYRDNQIYSEETDFTYRDDQITKLTYFDYQDDRFFSKENYCTYQDDQICSEETYFVYRDDKTHFLSDKLFKFAEFYSKIQILSTFSSFNHDHKAGTSIQHKPSRHLLPIIISQKNS